MQSLISDAKKTRPSSEHRTVLSVVSLLDLYVVYASALTDSLTSIKQDVDKNQKNLRLLSYAHEKLEQYARMDNLRLYNVSLK